MPTDPSAPPRRCVVTGDPVTLCDHHELHVENDQLRRVAIEADIVVRVLTRGGHPNIVRLAEALNVR